jgi:hypothetical protein
MSIEFGILDFCALMLVAYAAKLDGQLTYWAFFGLAAYFVLAWGIADFGWRALKDWGVIEWISHGAKF